MNDSFVVCAICGKSYHKELERKMFIPYGGEICCIKHEMIAAIALDRINQFINKCHHRVIERNIVYVNP